MVKTIMSYARTFLYLVFLAVGVLTTGIRSFLGKSAARAGFRKALKEAGLPPETIKDLQAEYPNLRDFLPRKIK